MLELLAPAGSHEAVTAAVQSGADAIYLGYGAHNARRNARNFTREELARAVAYCHVRGVKVYLTLNTLLFDNELRDAAEVVALAGALGLDAVLVQDLGALSLVRQVAPDLPIHASTQMSLMNLDAVRAAADLGCTRAVLARELSRDQIAHICAHSPIEIEVFVHGAHCMCYSGQCFFSSVIGTRSGNRGLCAQPCRQTYSWPGKSPKALLSLKDLSLAGHLRELEEMGVACVKIEGRMKRPEYVSVVTGIYSAAIREGREPSAEEWQALESAFSREGFTDGYFLGRTGRQMFGSRPENQPEPTALFAAARAHYEKEHPRVALSAHLELKARQPLRLTLQDGTHTVTVNGDPPQIARNRPTTAQDALERLKKTGGTPYLLSSATAEVEEGLMVPASGLNALRREGLDALTALRSAPPARSSGVWQPGTDNRGANPGLPVYTVALHSSAQLTPELLDCRPAVVYLPLEVAQQLRGQLSAMADRGIEPCVMLPRVIWDRELPAMERQLRELKQAGITSALVSNLGGIAPAKRAGLALRGDFGLEVANADCADQYRALGLQSVTLSFEQRLNHIRTQRKPLPGELFAYGRFPLMITENCIYKARDGGCREGCRLEESITDRRRARFPVVRAFGCRNEILNSLPLWLADRQSELARCGVWALRLSFTLESPEECVEIFRAYRSAAPCPTAFTRGLYFREVE